MTDHSGLKHRLFTRDGRWVPDPACGAAGGRWEVDCPGCGRTLGWREVTVDRYPIPGAMGGTYHIDNTRLMCMKCNNRAGMHDFEGRTPITAGMSEWQRRAWRRACFRSNQTVLTPREVFGPHYVPGQETPPPGHRRYRTEPASQPREDSA